MHSGQSDQAFRSYIFILKVDLTVHWCLLRADWCHNKKSAFDHIINPSLIELVQSRWLDIGTRGVLLISSGGVDQMIFLGLNFQFRDFFE